MCQVTPQVSSRGIIVATYSSTVHLGVHLWRHEVTLPITTGCYFYRSDSEPWVDTCPVNDCKGHATFSYLLPVRIKDREKKLNSHDPRPPTARINTT